MDGNGIYYEDQNGILQVFSNDFCRKLKKEPSISILQTIPLSRDISTLDNEWLTRSVTKDEV